MMKDELKKPNMSALAEALNGCHVEPIQLTPFQTETA